MKKGTSQIVPSAATDDKIVKAKRSLRQSKTIALGDPGDVVSDDGQSRKNKKGTPMSPPGVKSPQGGGDDQDGFGDLGKSLFKSADTIDENEEPKWKKNATKLVNAATKVGSYMANI